MDNMDQGSGGAPEQAASGDVQENNNTVQSVQPTASGGSETTQTVKYDSYRKAVSEKKKIQAQLEETSARLAELEETRLASEGKKDELIQSLQERVKKYKGEIDQRDATYAYKSVSSQLKAEAAKLGCVDPDTLIKVAPLDTLEVGEDYTVDAQSLKMLLDEQKEKMPYLFQSKSVAVKDGVPARPNTETTTDLSKMSIADKARLLAGLNAKK
jgi:hypothetical protein